MADYAFETPLGISVSELRVNQYPRVATLTFSYDRRTFGLQFDNPLPLSALTDAFDECWQIRIVDLNQDGSQLDFGRYKVELRDEDNPLTEFTVDRYEQTPMDATPAA